uniref:Uncharacterized protein n=1 Tax=Vespula pensylvanica TaxID=30213 RepID=A0A834K467_VESPE|nr:hypothetical protein H0235_015660 [Vespula pensylvanica]
MLPSWSRDRLKSLTLRKWGISTPNGKRLESPLTRWWVTENENVERRARKTALGRRGASGGGDTSGGGSTV